MKKQYLLCLIAFLWLQGCTLIRVDLGPTDGPLDEAQLLGEGDKKVLLIEIDGTIGNFKKSSPLGVPTGKGMVEEVREILDEAKDDEKIAALIVRVNSPGGTVTAGDLIFHEIMEFKKKKNIKVYSWILDLAASGGYYVSLAADSIIAHPTSVIGSIGVIAIKPNVEGLMEKIGVEVEVVKSVGKKDFLSPFRSMSIDERKLFQKMIDSFHQKFIDTILENRPNLSRKEVEEIADGRIFTSKEAFEIGFIDGIGYWGELETIINKELKVDGFRLVSYRRPGEYKSNIYSTIDDKKNLNMGLSLNRFFDTESPQFLYLWTP